MLLNGINGINAGTSSLTSITKNLQANNEVSFQDLLNNELGKTNQLLIQSEQVNNDFAVGKTDNIHEVMIASEKADIALQLTMQVRNKLMDAYSEIMRMQI